MKNKISNDVKKYIIIILIASLSYIIVNNLTVVSEIFKTIITVLLPFILGGVIAFILNIPMVKFERLLFKKIKNKKTVRGLSIVLSLLIFALVIALIAFLLIPELVQNIELLMTNIPTLIEKAQNWILNLLDKYPDIQVQIEKTFAESGNMNDILSTVLSYVANRAIGFISSLISSVVTLFTALIFSIYMLSQKEYLVNGSKKIVYALMKKERANKIVSTCKLTNKTFTKFISGQCLEAVILGLLIFISLSIFKIPYALIISVLTAVTALIPIFGAFIAMIIGVVLIAITNPIQAIIFVIVFLVVQQIEGNFIYPKVVGASVGLSPLWTLLAITVGGNLFGIVGMLIGLPLASVIYAIIKEIVNKKLSENNIKVI